MDNAQLIKTLASALELADLYLNSYDVSAPSRIKAETRAAVEEAIGLIKTAEAAQAPSPACDRCGALPGSRHDRYCLRPLLPRREVTA